MVNVAVPRQVAAEFRQWLKQSLEIQHNGPTEAGFVNLEYAHVEDMCDQIECELEEMGEQSIVEQEDIYANP